MVEAMLVDWWQGEIREGMFEWKIKRFLEKDKDRSTAFIFGRYNCVLLLQKFDEYYDFVLQCNKQFEKDTFSSSTYYKASIISSDGDEYYSVLGSIQTGQKSFPVMHFFDENQKPEGEDKFFKWNLEDTTESSDEDPEDMDVSSEEDHKDKVQVSEEDPEDKDESSKAEGETSEEDHEDEYEFVTKGILTFRLSWSYSRIKLDPPTVEDKTYMPVNHLISGTDHMELYNKLSKDIHALRSNNMNPDCVLKVGDKQFPVHREILSARSEVFAAMFRHDTIENSSGVVEIQDIEADVLDDILHYVYKGSLRLNENNAASMFAAANKFALTEARKICLKILMHNLTVENVGDAIVQAHVHKLSALKNIILQFIEKNAAELVVTNTWKEFTKAEQCLAVQYIQSALISTSRKLRSKK